MNIIQDKLIARQFLAIQARVLGRNYKIFLLGFALFFYLEKKVTVDKITKERNGI